MFSVIDFYFFVVDTDLKIREYLEETQGTLQLNLSNIHLQKQQIIPIFRSLNRENTLQVIDLSGCMLLNDGVHQLSSSLPSLNQLKSLNLSLNNITSEGIQYIANIFIDQPKTILENLYDLNLSYNLISDDSLRPLTKILSNTKIKKLNLCACNFTEYIFENNSDIKLSFEYLEILDLSYNKLNKDSICKFISFLNFKCITSLNFSHNSVTESGIAKDIIFKFEDCYVNNIKYMNLARCQVNDAEIWDFLR